MKRFLTTLVTVLVLTAALAVTASASTYDAAAEDLSKIGMFRGTEQGFELDPGSHPFRGCHHAGPTLWC